MTAGRAPARARSAARVEAPLRIRPARLEDAPRLAAVMRAAIRTLARGAYPPAILEAWSSLPPLYHRWAMSAGGERYLLAERGGRIAGYAARRGDELTAVFVRPSAARAGVGAALVARLEREARLAGVPALRVVAAIPAVPFYAALGFSTGRRTTAALPGERALEARRMRKALARPPLRRPHAGRRR